MIYYVIINHLEKKSKSFLREVKGMVGIVAEFDPFHNGHAAFVREAKRLTGQSVAVAVMSGTFTQRGGVAVMGKAARTECAVLGGVDAVFELPVTFALSPAERFAAGAVFLLREIGVTHLAFGSECGDTALLEKIAAALPGLLPKVRERMKDGTSFAAAREQLVRASLGEEAGDCLTRPNDILGIEYIKALNALASGIVPVAVKRDTDHHGASSASHVRSLLQNGEDVSAFVPESTAAVLARESLRFDDGRLCLAALRRMNAEEIARLPEMREGLENRVVAAAKEDSFASYVRAVACRRYTEATARRIACYALLGLTKEDLPAFPPYLRLLGANETGLSLLRGVKEHTKLPFVTKPADFADLLFWENRAADLSDLFAKKIQMAGQEAKNLPFFTKYLTESEKKG